MQTAVESKRACFGICPARTCGNISAPAALFDASSLLATANDQLHVTLPPPRSSADVMKMTPSSFPSALLFTTPGKDHENQRQPQPQSSGRQFGEVFRWALAFLSVFGFWLLESSKLDGLLWKRSTEDGAPRRLQTT